MGGVGGTSGPCGSQLQFPGLFIVPVPWCTSAGLLSAEVRRNVRVCSISTSLSSKLWKSPSRVFSMLAGPSVVEMFILRGTLFTLWSISRGHFVIDMFRFFVSPVFVQIWICLCVDVQSLQVPGLWWSNAGVRGLPVRWRTRSCRQSHTPFQLKCLTI